MSEGRPASDQPEESPRRRRLILGLGTLPFASGLTTLLVTRDVGAFFGAALIATVASIEIGRREISLGRLSARSLGIATALAVAEMAVAILAAMAFLVTVAFSRLMHD